MTVTRREFITTTAATGAAFMIVPRHVLGRGFQAPSDLVNVATVGFSGMGAVNTRAVMSQNVVAHLRRRPRSARRPARAVRENGEAGAAAATRPPGQPRWQGAGTQGAVAEFRDFGPSKAQLAAERALARPGQPRQSRALRRAADAAGREVPGLSRDAREAEGHRRDHRRDARPHARGDRVERDGRRQARLRAEAAVLVGARGAAPRHGRRRRRRSSRRWATSATRRTRTAARSSTSRAARSATCARCTSGRTGRSGSGRRACRVPRR